MAEDNLKEADDIRKELVGRVCDLETEVRVDGERRAYERGGRGQGLLMTLHAVVMRSVTSHLYEAGMEHAEN